MKGRSRLKELNRKEDYTMTNEEIRALSIDEVKDRLQAILDEIDADDADLDALEEEQKALHDREKEIRQLAIEEEEKRAKAVEEGITIKSFEEEERKMENIEIRNTKEYINAYAEYIKTGKDEECRALITENASGGIPVPELVEQTVKTAWENDALMQFVNKTYLKGNVKVGFELSAGGAVIHTEGTSAPSEESLSMGIVTMVPQSIKKWITISDEALDLDGGAFLAYVYEELTHQIMKKAADVLIGIIVASPTSSDADEAGVPQVSKAAGIDTVVTALGSLSDMATNNIAVMNKQTWATIRAAALAANYAADPFDGLTVVFNNTLPAYSSASSNAVYMIVGDFGYGTQANFPNGDTITLKYDDLSMAEADLVKIVGRMYVGMDVVAPNALVNVTKPSA